MQIAEEVSMIKYVRNGKKTQSRISNREIMGNNIVSGKTLYKESPSDGRSKGSSKLIIEVV